MRGWGRYSKVTLETRAADYFCSGRFGDPKANQPFILGCKPRCGYLKTKSTFFGKGWLKVCDHIIVGGNNDAFFKI